MCQLLVVCHVIPIFVFFYQVTQNNITNAVMSSLLLGTYTSIDNLIQSSLANISAQLRWIAHSEIVDVEPSQIDTVHYAVRKKLFDDGRIVETMVILLLLGSDETCTPAHVSEFARIYSLPTHKYYRNDSKFARYFAWLEDRNYMIHGFTKRNDSYYMVAEREFYYTYSRYGFCSACGLVRCSPVWCICGHKQLSNEWSSNNTKLDEFIKKSQIQTNSANEAYLEWIPFNCIRIEKRGINLNNSLPICLRVKLIPLEITDELHYDKLCGEHSDVLAKNIWVTIGFTYDAKKQRYYLIKDQDEIGFCLACRRQLSPSINTFCFNCKAPRPVNWTTGNKALDSFIMKSWCNMTGIYDGYIQWIEYSLLMNIQTMTLFDHGCTHTADWLEPNELTRVMLNKLVDGQNAQLFDFQQLTKEYPEILTPNNIWIIGITQEPSSQGYYLVFYHNMHALLGKFVQIHERGKCIQYTDFDEVKEIGTGGYGTVYTVKYRKYAEEHMPETVALKRFKNFDGMPELFISEFRNFAICKRFYYNFLDIYGITRDPETKDYMIVMQYVNNGNLLSFLEQNINKLTWKMKLQCLEKISLHLDHIHDAGIVLCNLHGGNIFLNYDNESEIEKDFRVNNSYICDLGLSRSMNSRKSNSTVRGVLPFIAPEVFHTRKFTMKSDIYSFGIIVYVMATGELPFRDRQFDRDLACDIVGGLRPAMPDSAPERYKNLAQMCCEAVPDKRPAAHMLWKHIYAVLGRASYFDENVWNTIYHTHVRPLSRYEKESKYSSKFLPIGDLPKSRNSYEPANTKDT